MKQKRFELLCWALAFLPLLVTAAIFHLLPDSIPMHWNAAGEIDRWGARSAAWHLPLMAIGANLLFVLLPKIDPKRRNYAAFQKSYGVFRLAFNLFVLVTMGVSLSSAIMPGSVRTELLIPAAVGALFCVLGNYMPKFKHNYFVGIKTPWTLASEEVWRSTHRLGGALWFWGGLLLIAAAFLLPPRINAIATTAVLLCIVLVPCGYSFFAYQKRPRE